MARQYLLDPSHFLLYCKIVFQRPISLLAELNCRRNSSLRLPPVFYALSVLLVRLRPLQFAHFCFDTSSLLNNVSCVDSPPEYLRHATDFSLTNYCFTPWSDLIRV